MNKIISLPILKLSVIMFIIQMINISWLFAQDSTSAEGYTTTISLKAIKNNDGSRTYTSKLTGEGEKGTFPVYEAEIFYYNDTEGQNNLLGNVTTNKDGIGVFNAQQATKYQKDKEGFISIKAVFKGSEEVKGSEAVVKFKDLDLSLNLEEKDSVHTITIHAASVDARGEQIPLKETLFNVYVQGLFSKLKIGDCFVDNGEGSFIFPDNIPGDENGNTKIFVKLEEDENFGDVEKVVLKKWGQHRLGFVEKTRSLWSQGAPLWMIITLTVLLVGVWSHYLYAIVQLVKIRKDGIIFDKEVKNV